MERYWFGYSAPFGNSAFFPLSVYHSQKAQRTSVLNFNIIEFLQFMNTKGKHPWLTWNSLQLKPAIPFPPASKNLRKACQHISAALKHKSLTRTVSKVNPKGRRVWNPSALTKPIYKYLKHTRTQLSNLLIWKGFIELCARYSTERQTNIQTLTKCLALRHRRKNQGLLTWRHTRTLSGGYRQGNCIWAEKLGSP